MKDLRRLGSTGVAALTVLVWLLAAGAATAQGHCTMDQLAGTYAYEFHGSSTFVVEPAPPPFRHWSMVSAPFLSVGWITIERDGTVDGEAWVILGTLASGLSARPFENARLTDLDESTCTAVFEWMGTPTPQLPPGPHRDRFVFVDGGRQFRSMLMSSPSGSMAWTGRGYRITDAPFGTCGPHLLRGGVLLQCETLESEARMPAPASAASMSVLAVAADGSYEGVSFKKSPAYAELLVEGAFDVQPNCTLEAELASEGLPGVVQYGRGVIFDSGKRGFLMMPIETAQPDGSIVRPGYSLCELLTIGN